MNTCYTVCPCANTAATTHYKYKITVWANNAFKLVEIMYEKLNIQQGEDLSKQLKSKAVLITITRKVKQ